MVEIFLSYGESLIAIQLWIVLEPDSRQLGHRHVVKFRDVETNELVCPTNAPHLD